MSQVSSLSGVGMSAFVVCFITNGASRSTRDEKDETKRESSTEERLVDATNDLTRERQERRAMSRESMPLSTKCSESALLERFV